MASSHEKDDSFYTSVLNRCHKFLIEYLDPVSTLSRFLDEEYLQRFQVRDIQELRTSSEQNREIIEKVKSKGRKGYEVFIGMLRTTGQEGIAGYLSNKEREMAATMREAAAPPQRQLPGKSGFDTAPGELNIQPTDAPSLRTKITDKGYRPPKDSCIYDGRLLKLEKKDIDSLEKKCTEPIGTGGIGKVYTSKDNLEEFGMRVAVKKIPSGTNAARRERIASRILHPFILPLLAVVDCPNKKEVWFVSPYCENGDLYGAIKDDHDDPDLDKIRLNQAERIRILLQISLALEYIHTEVPNVRDAVLHKDISSKNVVLDANLNARLIDFGLAREKNDNTSITKAGKECYSHPDFGKRSAKESWDYFAFGVVIREMLTGLRPEGDGTTFLKFWGKKEVRGELQKNVWLSHGPEIVRKATVLNNIAETCLQEEETKTWTATHFKGNVVDKLNEIFQGTELQALPEDYKRCHICFINPSASESPFKQSHAVYCTQEIKACIACEKNSFLNPIRCYCGEDLKPSIGYRWGALLVAGNDTISSRAQALTKDLEEFKKLITSKAPLIMGISEENVRVVVPKEPGKPNDGEELSSKVKEELQYFRSVSESSVLDTLLIYLSCHGIKGNCSEDEDCKNRFQLDSESDSITHDEFEKELGSLEKIGKLLVILDCCFPPLLNVQGRRQIVQINACEMDQQTVFNDDGSIFTKYVIQGLKAKAEKKCSDDCKSCNNYWAKRGDFITIHSLFEFVIRHMEKVNEKLIPDKQQKQRWECIAYNTDEVVEIDFTSDQGKQQLQLKYFQNMRQLEKELLKKFGQDEEKTTVKIKKDTYRTDHQYENCDTLEKVMLAWTLRQPLYVEFLLKKNPLD